MGLFGTACSAGSDGGDGDGDAKGSGTASGKNDEDQAVVYRKCLRDNGLKVPEPKGDGDQKGVAIGGDNKAAVEKAIKACRDKAPEGRGGGKASQADRDKMVKFAACMRKHGVDVPVPKADGGVAKARPIPKGEAEKKKHEKASKACEGELR
ncbi:hypothetical protein G5C65_23010 [Streptomyces sp. SB3404]|uniref:Uncharacterized protein n=1 Tax=Streptomyces boncukensis TaxID=2711219 RepID=A0A6G4X2V2_9ACTN|nr:hypothetical protein [Streptomyces boncukensis]